MMDLSISLLEEKIKSYQPDADLDRIREAHRFSSDAHGSQRRVGGGLFIKHPLAVAIILAELELDLVTLVAALLHDVVEDTDVTLEELEERFGREVALLVDGVTKLGRLDTRSRLEEQAENMRKMLLAMAKDIRVILIKLADRLHNMRTLGRMDPAHRELKSRETLEIFAPLAHRLGIARLQWELEDLALSYLEPEKYRQIMELVPSRRRERERYAGEIIDTLSERLEEADIEADIQGRAKHFYSIYRKMFEQERDMSDIYDLVAVRVIVDSVKDCYGALGIVHTLWRPVPGRFKDFVAVPKGNMYQSLHTTVVGPQGEPFEIQIRTWDMHRTAEYGIAAHWRYKEGTSSDEEFERKLAWLRQILEWQHDLRDAREFMESLKIDLFTDEVFVYTPKGDVINLPSGSTPLDFAYRIHTEVGHRCSGAKVNGRIIPLDQELNNGDVVEILTSKSQPGPSPDWLNIVKTSTAKSKIRQWFKKERRGENLERGQKMLLKEVKALGYEEKTLLQESYLEDLRRRHSMASTDDLLVAIGYGGIAASTVAARLRHLHQEEEKDQEGPEEDIAKEAARVQPDGNVVRVQGLDNMLVRFSRCCNPVPGDDIVGYVTRGRGVSIHRSDCANMVNYLDDEGRVIQVSWDHVEAKSFPAEIIVQASDRPGLLSDLAAVVADEGMNILSAKARTRPNELATVDLVVEIRSLNELDYLGKKLAQIKDVVSVDRVSRAGKGK